MTEHPIDVRPATGEDWPEVEQLFGPGGASNGCWCQYWLLGTAYHRRERTENLRDLAGQLNDGRAGLLARLEGRPVGWARLSPRSELSWLTARFAQYPFTADDPWSLSCFFVPSRSRGLGVMRALIDAAVTWGQEHRTTVEAYPIDPAVPGATRNRFPGVLAPFLAAGFVEHGRLGAAQVVVRREAP